ncbi:MAG TPA: hypothetical protein VFO73_10945 [Candidatus Limnocylindrales bacterium]|nr:hypothetical protein [Candidatus Limnocylindrales bacterium]
MEVPDRTIDVRRRPEPRLRVALTGWYDPDSVSFEAHAHEAARKALAAPRREGVRGPGLVDRA